MLVPSDVGRGRSGLNLTVCLCRAAFLTLMFFPFRTHHLFMFCIEAACSSVPSSLHYTAASHYFCEARWPNIVGLLLSWDDYAGYWFIWFRLPVLSPSLSQGHFHQVLGRGCPRVVGYWLTVELGESLLAQCALFHCLVSPFPSLSSLLRVSTMCSCSVLVGWGSCVLGAVMHSVCQFRLHPSVSVSSLVFFMTRSATNFLFLFKGLFSLKWEWRLFLLLDTVGFHDF